MDDVRLQLHNHKKEQQAIVKAMSGVQSGVPAATQIAVRVELLEERVMQVTQAQDEAQDASVRTASQQTQQAEELQSAYVKLHAWTTEVAAKATPPAARLNSSWRHTEVVFLRKAHTHTHTHFGDFILAKASLCVDQPLMGLIHFILPICHVMSM